MAANSVAAAWLVDPIQVQEEYHSPTVVASRVVVETRLLAAATLGSAMCTGIIVWKGHTTAIPAVADTPDPLVDGDFDWLFRYPLVVATGTPIGTLFSSATDSSI